MNGGPITKTVKIIKVDIDKCTGCCACEMACSAFHAKPQYSSINPARARIRVVVDELTDQYVPIRAGDYTKAECNGRNVYTIKGKEYSECSFCSASCPARSYFVEPDSGLPLKCDMCESVPPLAKPMCVEVCKAEALTYLERDVKRQEKLEPAQGQIEVGLEFLIDQYGIAAVAEKLSELSKEKAE